MVHIYKEKNGMEKYVIQMIKNVPLKKGKDYLKTTFLTGN